MYVARPVTLVVKPVDVWQYGNTGLAYTFPGPLALAGVMKFSSGFTSRMPHRSRTVWPLFRPPCIVSRGDGRAVTFTSTPL